MVSAVPPMAAKPRAQAMALEAANCLMVLIPICVAFQVFCRLLTALIPAKMRRYRRIGCRWCRRQRQWRLRRRWALDVSVLDGEQFVVFGSRLVVRTRRADLVLRGGAGVREGVTDAFDGGDDLVEALMPLAVVIAVRLRLDGKQFV